MPAPLTVTLDGAAALARSKARDARRLPRYLWLSALAGAYVGVAVVLLLSVAGPLAAAEAPATKLVQGAVFGVALTLVVFAGSELFTGNAMYLLQGWYARSVRGRDVALVWAASLAGNLVGSAAFAGLVHAGGTLSSGATDGQPGPAQALLSAIVTGKQQATGTQLLWRSVLCNLLVCLGLWMAARATDDVAKLVVLWWALLAFIASGFEHSVANMTIFSLAVLDGASTWAALARNLAWTVPGNVIGGGILVGLAYAWVGGARPAAAGRAVVEDREVPEPAEAAAG